MLSGIGFNIKEGIRNLCLLPRQSLVYFLFLLINHLFIIIFFSIYVNLNYMKELSVINSASFSLSISLLPTTNKLDSIILLLFVTSLIFLLLTIHTNKIFIKKYLKLNSAEIQLIWKLNGKNNLVRTPIIYSAFIVNFFSIILILAIIKAPYRKLFKFVTENNPGLKMLDYNGFNISLFIFLFLITTIVVVFSSYFLFWDMKK